MNKKENIFCKAIVNNMPGNLDHGFLVARAVDSELWYYGVYSTDTKAKEVAKEIVNGIVLEV